ncbi:MAG: hypothetical protein RLZZ519_449 [Bacteroidota bacterium]|jgi:hypothetical protein
MKILLKIVITFLLFFSMLFGMLFSYTNTENAKDLKNSEALIGAMGAVADMLGAGSQMDGIPTASDYQTAVYIDVVFFLMCIVGIVFTFLKAKKGGLIVAGILGVMAILFFAMQPMLKGAAFEGENDDKTLALAFAITAFIGAALLGLLKFKFTGTPSVSDASENSNTEDSRLQPR